MPRGDGTGPTGQGPGTGRGMGRGGTGSGGGTVGRRDGPHGWPSAAGPGGDCVCPKCAQGPTSVARPACRCMPQVWHQDGACVVQTIRRQIAGSMNTTYRKHQGGAIMPGFDGTGPKNGTNDRWRPGHVQPVQRLNVRRLQRLQGRSSDGCHTEWAGYGMPYPMSGYGGTECPTAIWATAQVPPSGELLGPTVLRLWPRMGRVVAAWPGAGVAASVAASAWASVRHGRGGGWW